MGPGAYDRAQRGVEQVENEIVMLERMGDPKAFGANLLVFIITGLAAIYQQGKQDVEELGRLC